MITEEEFWEINSAIHSRIQGWFGSEPTKLIDKSFTRDEIEEIMDQVGHPSHVEVYPVQRDGEYYLYFYRYPDVKKDADKYNVDCAEKVYDEVADGFKKYIDSKLYRWFHRYSSKIPKTPDR